MYVIVSYTRPRDYRYWTGRGWSRARRDAKRYAVRSRAFIDALGRATDSPHSGSIGLLRERG